jgi:hypothetical protein
MNKTILTFALTTSLILGAIFMGCNSPAQKEEAAETKLENAEQNLEAAQNDAAAQKVATAEEWKLFKRETDLKIKENEIRIEELKIKINKPGKVLDAIYVKRIESLEQKNKDLKTRMETYETRQSDWEVFKHEFNKDMDVLGQSLSDFTVDSKK